MSALSTIRVNAEWGETSRYDYWDHDEALKEVYAFDFKHNWQLYGFPYELNGDRVVIDFDAGKAKKLVVVDFDDGETLPSYQYMAERVGKTMELERTLEVMNAQLESGRVEMESLRAFRADVEAQVAAKQREEIFSKFTDLNGIEAFEALRNGEDSTSLTPAELEEKCYALRGRYGAPGKFSLSDVAIRLPVDGGKEKESAGVYGGLFDRFPPK